MDREEFITTPKGRGTSTEQQKAWQKKQLTPIDIIREASAVIAYIEAIESYPTFSPQTYTQIVKKLSKQGLPVYSKPRLREAYLELVEEGDLAYEVETLNRLTTKPIRTSSGVAPITVLTKPYPCPGQCIFCPTDVRMPKSYLRNEPGAMRALQHEFDPYKQTRKRIEAFERLGHPAEKIELLVLGGTWSHYPERYRENFIKRCLDAMNEMTGESLLEAQQKNETAKYRNVGLVIETRPDFITPEEVKLLRIYGVTRVQLGVQSLDDHILAINRRGHTADQTRTAIELLRRAGFKISIHWMTNLLGATPESDYKDFLTLWDDPALRPDEIKIYPTSLLDGTELHQRFQRGEYQPYTDDQLIDLVINLKEAVPPYCRINRVMRDIPAPEIVSGVTKSNLRQIVKEQMALADRYCSCIRCREIRHQNVDIEQLSLHDLIYKTSHGKEHFITAETPDGKIAGFLRLSLPDTPPLFEELAGKALIRQIQVYGPAASIKDERDEKTQHQGIGTRLLKFAREVAISKGYQGWSVIAAIGTREYYRKQGFLSGEYYMHEMLNG